MTKKNISLLLKTAITCLLIFILFWIIDWRESLQIIAGISLPMVSVLFSIMIFMIGISCLKWKIFLHARKIYVPFHHLFTLYMVGYFFNNFLPSNVGGDVARGMILGKQIKNASDSFGSVFLERFTGLLGLLILACIVFALNMKLIRIPSIGMFLCLFLVAFFVMGFLLFSERTRKIFNVIISAYPLKSIKDKLIKFLDAIYYFRNQPMVLTKAMLISFLFHFMTVINTLAVCMALDIPVSIMDLATIVPIILLIAVFPVSLNGIGVWEGSFAYFFSLIGVAPAAALSVALVLRGLNIVTSLMGGICLLFLNRLSSSDTPYQKSLADKAAE
jgi:uncharacterized protein (TIRG00374 family)